MGNSIRARAPRGAVTCPDIVRDPESLSAHLEDAAHYPGGHADGLARPRSEADTAAILRAARRVLPVGAQSSLTGGATPFGEVLLSTSGMRSLEYPAADRVVAGAGVTLDLLQQRLEARGARYPPVPTYLGATVGGAVATNAAGAATFKYGATRGWVEALTIVLANGDVLDVARGDCTADADGFCIHLCGGATARVPVGSYRMPAVPKCSAGYYAAPGMDLVDLFIGAEGTLGVITTATLRTVRLVKTTALALIFCRSESAGLEIVRELREASMATWQRDDPAGIDACAIESMDAGSLALLRVHGDLDRLHVTAPSDAALALLVQLELPAGTTADRMYDDVATALEPDARPGPIVSFCRLLAKHGVLEASELAAPGDTARQAQLLHVREAVPTRVNQEVGAAQRDRDPRIGKTAADMIVPFEAFGEMMRAYRDSFERRGLRFAIWGHVSDGNVHPNVIPASYEDVERGRDAIRELGRTVARLGGCPLAEHGVGRNPVKQALLLELYGQASIDEMRAVKRALDPEWKLAPGVIFPAETG